MKAHGLNPRIRKSPFFEVTLNYGATEFLNYGATEFHPYNGMWLPVGLPRCQKVAVRQFRRARMSACGY
jgi:hypothetical protein